MCMSNITPEQVQQEVSLAGPDAHPPTRELVAQPAAAAARDAVCQAKTAWSSLEQLLAWRAASASATEGEGFLHESDDDEPGDEVSVWELISKRSAGLCGTPETANLIEYDTNYSSGSVRSISEDPAMLSEVEVDCVRSLSSKSSSPQRQSSSATPSYQRLVDLIPQGGSHGDPHSIGRTRQRSADVCAADSTRASRHPKLRLSRSCCGSLCFGMGCCCLLLAKDELGRAERPWRWFWAVVEWFPCGAGCLLPAASPRSSRSSSHEMSQQTSPREVSSTPRAGTGTALEPGA